MCFRVQNRHCRTPDIYPLRLFQRFRQVFCIYMSPPPQLVASDHLQCTPLRQFSALHEPQQLCYLLFKSSRLFLLRLYTELSSVHGYFVGRMFYSHCKHGFLFLTPLIISRLHNTKQSYEQKLRRRDEQRISPETPRGEGHNAGHWLPFPTGHYDILRLIVLHPLPILGKFIKRAFKAGHHRGMQLKGRVTK